MECACIDFDGDGDQASVYRAETRTARKSHKCRECKREIRPGEEYEHVKGLWCGEWDTIKTCTDCISLRDAFFCGSCCHGMVREEISQFISDGDGDVGSEQILNLTPTARDWVFEKIERAWESIHDEEEEKPC